MNEIRKSNRSPLNRIQSILEDSEYVSSVESVYNRPLVANMRCGLWYVRPERLREKCYFKSTDGHTRQWQFSVKRLNLHIIDLIEQKNGCIIVDSTRRGKVMPDALSKTVPIWCAVLNCALLGLSRDESLFLPKCVSPSEQDQIKQLVPEWTARFKQLVPKENWPKLTKPLHPIFVNQSAMLPMYEFRPDEEIIEGSYPVILCTASKQAQDGEIQMPGYIYVQGAADDHELWAPAHFSAEMMWANPNLREVGLSDSELVNRMQDAVEGFSQTPPTEPKLIPAARQIYITYDTFEPKNGQWAIDLRPEAAEASRTLSIPLADGKRGSRDLAVKLETIAKFFESHNTDEFVIVGSKNSDFAECVALMLNCRYFTPSELRDQPAKYVSKEEVTKRNASIIASTGSIPSRTTQNVMRIKDLSHSERVERARKIEMMMQLPRIMKQYESISAFDSDKGLPNDKEELYALISLPSKLSTFLRAAFLVRSNFDQWNVLVKNPSSKPSSVFKSILDDKLLVFLLFWCDIIMVFHLDPRSPFLDCDRWNKESYIICTNIDHEVGTEEKILDFWAALGMPGKETLWGKDMGELEMMRSETIGRERRHDNFCLGWYFYRIAYKFDLSFLTDIYNGEASTDEMLFNMTEFVLKASGALAFDMEELSILESLMRLFPQFPPLVANVSKKYILDVNELNLSTVDYQHTKYRVLEEEFGCNLMYRSDYVNMFPCNQSLLKMFKRYPQLYTRWAADAEMQHLYYMLVAPPSAFLTRDK